MNKSKILIAFKTYTEDELAVIKSGLGRLARKFEIIGISNIYKVDRVAQSLAGLRGLRREERLEGLCLVVKAETELPAEEVLRELSEIETQYKKNVIRKAVSLNLMVYDEIIVMQPELSLPHPEMHLRPEELIPAVEVWPEYIHPILKLSLLELSRRFKSTNWGEFFTQSQGLLDF